MIEMQPYLDNLLSYIERNDYCGYDPYDALNSPLLRRVGSTGRWMRVGLTQFLRRCPINLRPVLATAKGHNPKGIGLFLWGYVKLYTLERRQRYLDAIDHLLDLLEDLRCTGYSGNCWGYNFDWQSRLYLRPKGTPTIVNSSFVGHALLDCFEMTGVARALDLALSVPDFILNDLYRTPWAGTFCFSYSPTDMEVVHNANLLGASVLLRLAKYRHEQASVEAGLRSLAFSMRHQRPDGSWYYADTVRQKWIDSFHTGFNLQALRFILKEGYAGEYASAYRKGVQYYADNFFLADGTPKYYHQRLYPIDIHAPAQAVSFFSGEGEKYSALTDKIAQWMLDHMYDSRGFFYFRKGRFLTNRIPYMRWSQAWAFHALADYLFSQVREREYCEST